VDCWKCNKTLIDLPRKINFRAECPHCGADVHVCKNCRYYAPGKPNDCAVPGTEFIKDREAMNFCEEFAIKTESEKKPPSKTNFNSLFKDE
jgi:hypothetical protein